MTRGKISLSLIILVFILSNCGSPADWFKSVVPDSRRLTLMPGSAQIFKGSLKDRTIQRMSLVNLPPEVKIQLVDNPEAQSGAVDGVLTYNETPLCEYGFTSSSHDKGLLVLGRIPESTELPPLSDEGMPDKEHSLSVSYELAGSKLIVGPYELLSQELCYVIRDDELRAVYINIFTDGNGLPYQSLADDFEAYTMESRHFHATGKAKIFDLNPLDGKLKEFSLGDLDSSGRLSSSTHYTDLPSEFGSSPAISSRRVFDYSSDTTSGKFIETSVYTNIERTINWFESIGFKPPSGKLKVVPGKEFTNGGRKDKNNAMYLPAQAGNPDTILIGLGDGVGLKNLALDSDVVSHEYAHHVIFQRLQGMNTENETLIIHEGMADMFTFARTGDSCLGESICPESSTACQVAGKCLRSAANTFDRSDLLRLKGAPHLAGQVISGLFWDLVRAGHNTTEVAQLGLASLQLMPSASTISNLIVAMVQADETNYNRKFCSEIKGSVETRDLTSLFIGTIDCTDTNVKIEARGSTNINDSGVETTTEKTVGSATTSKSRSGGGGGCGIIGGSSMESQFFTLLLMLLPLGFLMVRPRVSTASEVARSRRVGDHHRSRHGK